MKKVEAFIIHLDRATQRRPQVDTLLTKLRLPASVIDAVDGTKLSSEEISAVYRPRLHRPRYPFELRSTEVGCFLSHRKAWQAIVGRGLDVGLIIEDDVTIDPSLFPPMLDFAIAHCRESDLIRFPYRTYTDKGEPVVSEGDMILVEPRLLGLGMQMQLVGAKAARALLDATELFDRPVDTLIQMPGIAGVRTLAARPTCIRQIGHLLGGTVVQKTHKPFTEVLSREVRRALYRASVRIRTRKGVESGGTNH